MKASDEKASSTLLKIFGINEEYCFSFVNGTDPDSVLLSNEMLQALCCLLQNKVPSNVEILLPCQFIREHKVARSERSKEINDGTVAYLASFRNYLVKKVIEKGQQTDTIIIPFIETAHWQLMTLQLQPNNKEYHAVVTNTCEKFSKAEKNLLLEGKKKITKEGLSNYIAKDEYMQFATMVQKVLGRISSVSYRQVFLQEYTSSCGYLMFMNILSDLKILNPLELYPAQFEKASKAPQNDYWGLRIKREADLHWRKQVLGLLLIKNGQFNDIIKQRTEDLGQQGRGELLPLLLNCDFFNDPAGTPKLISSSLLPLPEHLAVIPKF